MRLFTLLLISFAALSYEMIDEKLDDSSVTTIANNQIWYTSTDGKIVEPYSDWINNYADALTTFGVNIVSNTYADGKGVIEFDGNVTTIGCSAFYGCDSLTSVTIPDSVTTIGYEAFAWCGSLTSVTIPDSVTSIGAAAFYVCSSLTSVTIPNSVTTIGGGAFSCCENLTSVTIPDSVTTIGNGVFSVCGSLQEFKGKFASKDGRCLIIDGVLNSFAPAGLTEYTIPDSVTSIGDRAFYGCSSLTSVTIGDSVRSIGNYTFYYCSSLTSVYCKAVTPPTGGNDMFSYHNDYATIKPIGCTIYVPTESVEAYKSAEWWSDYASAIVGYNF